MSWEGANSFRKENMIISVKFAWRKVKFHTSNIKNIERTQGVQFVGQCSVSRPYSFLRLFFGVSRERVFIHHKEPLLYTTGSISSKFGAWEEEIGSRGWGCRSVIGPQLSDLCIRVWFLCSFVILPTKGERISLNFWLSHQAFCSWMPTDVMHGVPWAHGFALLRWYHCPEKNLLADSPALGVSVSSEVEPCPLTLDIIVTRKMAKKLPWFLHPAEEFKQDAKI
jgi:hypothetical protein